MTENVYVFTVENQWTYEHVPTRKHKITAKSQKEAFKKLSEIEEFDVKELEVLNDDEQVWTIPDEYVIQLVAVV